LDAGEFRELSNLQINISALSSNTDFVIPIIWPICSLAGRRDEHRNFGGGLDSLVLHVCVHTYFRQEAKNDTDAPRLRPGNRSKQIKHPEISTSRPYVWGNKRKRLCACCFRQTNDNSQNHREEGSGG